MTTVTRQITTGTDDAKETSSGTVTLTDNGVNTSTLNDMGGFRFPNMTVPPGAKIVSATFQANTPNSKIDSPNNTIWGQLATNGATFATTANNISSRTKTTASKSWIGTDLGNAYQNVDVTAIVQEIVNQSGWASGNAIVLLSKFNGGGEGVLVASVETGTGTTAAKLVVNYEVRGAGTILGHGYESTLKASPDFSDTFTSLGSYSQYKLTEPGGTTTPYTLSIVSGKLRLTGNATGPRNAIIPASVADMTDSEVFSRWEAFSGLGLAQHGHVHRMQVIPGVGARALTVTKNIFGDNSFVNMHVMDASSGPGGPDGNYHQFAGQQLTALISKPFPWNVKTRCYGNILEVKVWLDTEGEPAWGDAAHSYKAFIPGSGDSNSGHEVAPVGAGKSGLYMGHITTGDTADFDNLTITAMSSGVAKVKVLNGGSSAGVGSADATGARVVELAAGTAGGVGSAIANAKAIVLAAGSASGVGSAQGAGLVSPPGVISGVANGEGSASADGLVLALATGTSTSSGAATANGLAQTFAGAAASGGGDADASALVRVLDGGASTGAGLAVGNGNAITPPQVGDIVFTARQPVRRYRTGQIRHG